MNLLCVSGMINNTNAFKALREYLEKRGDRVELVATTKSEDFEAAAAAIQGVPNADVVLVGLASSEALSRPEVAAVTRAYAAGKPFGFFVDFPGVLRGRGERWFGPTFLANAAFVFLVNERDEADARELCPRATACVTGHPKNEGAEEIMLSRSELRKALNLSEDSFVVLITGTKTQTVNEAVIGVVKSAYDILRPAGEWAEFSPTFLYLQHPGEEGVDARVYEGCGGHCVRVISKGGKIGETSLSAETLLPAADVFLNIASTAVDRAGYLRMPILWALPREVREILKRNSGFAVPSECGGDEPVAMAVTDGAELALALRSLWKRESLGETLRHREESYYPIPTPPKGTAVKAMVEVLDRILREQPHV